MKFADSLELKETVKWKTGLRFKMMLVKLEKGYANEWMISNSK